MALGTTLTFSLAPGSSRVPVVREGMIVTGDTFVANPAQRDQLRQALKASAGFPLLVIRSITDSADGGTPDAYRVNIDAASRNAATLTLAVIADAADRR